MENIIFETTISIGLSSIVIAFIYIGRKLQILDDMKRTMEDMKGNLKVIGDFLTRNHKNFDPSELRALSPLGLTPSGREFIKDLGFDSVLEKNKNDFFNYIDGEHPKLKYDVETAAIKSIYALGEKSYMEFLKIFFYANPARNMENTAPTLGVYIRDRYLAEHPEITR